MLSSTPPRRIAFTTTDLDGVRKLALARIYYSYSTQNRLDAVMHRLGRLYARMRFYLLARARGHGDLPSFCEGNREAAGRALLALTPLAKASSAGHAFTAGRDHQLPPACSSSCCRDLPCCDDGLRAQVSHWW